jgi:hypothetical protein
MKLLDPFRKLPEGYYRLFLSVWVLLPFLVAILLYLLVSILGSNDMYAPGPNKGDAWDIAVKVFLILLFIYYPLTRIGIWVWQGFLKESGLEAKHAGEILSLKKQKESELLSLNKQIGERDKSIKQLQSDLKYKEDRLHERDLGIAELVYQNASQARPEDEVVVFEKKVALLKKYGMELKMEQWFYRGLEELMKRTKQ